MRQRRVVRAAPGAHAVGVAGATGRASQATCPPRPAFWRRLGRCANSTAVAVAADGRINDAAAQDSATTTDALVSFADGFANVFTAAVLAHRHSTQVTDGAKAAPKAETKSIWTP